MSDPLAEAMAQFLELMVPVRAATVGYRTSLIEEGFDASTADTMAGDFHRLCVASLLNGIYK